MTYKTVEDRDIEFARQMAESISLDMKVMLNNEKDRMDKLQLFIDHWDRDLENPDTDPRRFLTPDVIGRAMEHVEAIHHIHTGSTDYSVLSRFRRRVLIALAGRDN